MTALRMLAIGSEQRDFAQGDVLFKAGDDATPDILFSAARFGSRTAPAPKLVAGPGALIGQLALVAAMKAAVDRDRAGKVLGDPPSRAACFSACLESDPAAARRLRR